MSDAIIPAPYIGDIVQRARKEHRLTLEQLAERCGVSKSMLSQIERGNVNPTFAVVWRLSQALGIDLNMVGEQAEEQELIQHTHAYSTPIKKSADGQCALRLLSPARTVLPLEWYELTMKRGGILASEPHALGTYEHLTCLDGRVQVEVADRSVIGKAGDTLRYRADRPHKITNMARGASRALLLIALPTQYDSRPV